MCAISHNNTDYNIRLKKYTPLRYVVCAYPPLVSSGPSRVEECGLGDPVQGDRDTLAGEVESDSNGRDVVEAIEDGATGTTRLTPVTAPVITGQLQAVSNPLSHLPHTVCSVCAEQFKQSSCSAVPVGTLDSTTPTALATVAKKTPVCPDGQFPRKGPDNNSTTPIKVADASKFIPAELLKI